MKENICKNCEYYFSGFCWRYPPQIYVITNERDGGDQRFDDHPIVEVDDWCGEFKAKEVGEN